MVLIDVKYAKTQITVQIVPCCYRFVHIYVTLIVLNNSKVDKQSHALFVFLSFEVQVLTAYGKSQGTPR